VVAAWPVVDEISVEEIVSLWLQVNTYDGALAFRLFLRSRTGPVIVPVFFVLGPSSLWTLVGVDLVLGQHRRLVSLMLCLLIG